MFSIIDTGLVKALVWFSPGSRAKSSLAPHSARPVADPGALPAPSLIVPRLAGYEECRRATAQEPGASHTPETSSVRESSHTQEFTTA
jgi:hypothetical protein